MEWNCTFEWDSAFGTMTRKSAGIASAGFLYGKSLKISIKFNQILWFRKE